MKHFISHFLYHITIALVIFVATSFLVRVAIAKPGSAFRSAGHFQALDSSPETMSHFLPTGMPDDVHSKLALHALMTDSDFYKDRSFSVDLLSESADSQFSWLQVKLSNARLGKIKLLIRGPLGFLKNAKKHRVLLLAAGFHIGRESVSLLGPSDNTILVGYDYPFSPEEIKEDPTKIIETVRTTPGQIALSLKYLSMQEWTDEKQIGIAGISLGGLFLPSALRLTYQLGVTPQRVIFGFTGGEIRSVVELTLPKNFPELIKNIVANSLANLTSAYAPQNHLRFLRGQFFLIRASEEQVFTEESWNTLVQQLPLPKSIAIIKGTHIDQSKKEMIAETQKSINAWWPN